jgi:hypothetical protein
MPLFPQNVMDFMGVGQVIAKIEIKSYRLVLQTTPEN